MLAELEERLTAISHTEEALAEVQRFCLTLKDTRARLAVWNSTNAIIRSPIMCEDAINRGFNEDEDEFVLLQGDIVTTESAYSFGLRVTGGPKYAVLNSSCDLVPKRRTAACLLPIREIRRTDQNALSTLNQLLQFRRRDSMYLPRLVGDPPEIAGHAISFDGICQITLSDLLVATRIASLSLVGWRIFASFARVAVARAGDREIAIRRSFETLDHPEQPTVRTSTG